MALWIGQFGMVDGEAKEETPWVGVYPDPGRSEEPSDLYVLVEPALPGSEEFCGEMKDAIGDVYHAKKASLTGGILRALRSAHENLRDWNRRSLKEHRVAAGVSCVAVQEQEAYLAQIAPATAVFAHDGKPELVQPAIPDASEPLGMFDEFWPDFRRFEIADGDRLLLISPALAESIPPETIASALRLPGEEALPELYRAARGRPNCAALLICGVPDAETSEGAAD